jgi:hypothetical protein
MKIPSEAEFMPLTITMGHPVETIMQELTDPAYRCVTQESVAITYAFCLAQLGIKAPWKEINSAIRERWRGRGALERIKKLACHQAQAIRRKRW